MLASPVFRIFRLSAWVLLVLIGSLTIYSAVGAWRIEQAYPPIGEFVDIDGLRIHYLDAGKGQPVVLIHGASTTLQDFTASLFYPLATQYRVIAFDRPGYGYSERPWDSWPDPVQQAELIKQALDRLGVKRAILVGHSWSGSVVLAYMLHYPEAVAGGVLLAGGSHPWKGGVDWIYEVAGWPVIGSLFAATLVYPAGQLMLDQAIDYVFVPNAVPDDYQERAAVRLALRPDTFRANAQDLRELSDFLRGQSQHYSEIKQPLLLISGDADGVVPAWNHADRLIKQIPQAQLVMMKNTGHAPHHVHTEQVVKLIDDFAARIDARVVSAQ